MSELTQHVPLSAIRAAVRNLYGKDAVLESHRATPATPNVQGFSSHMLRLQVTVRPRPSEPPRELSLIAKCLPAVLHETDKQRDTIRRFCREVEFFTSVMPRLSNKVPDLPVVRCHLVQSGLLLMEDLNQRGFDTLAQGMKEVGKILLTQSHVELVLEKLACLHAASLDVDWLKEIPMLEHDNMFYIEESPTSFYTMCIQAFKAASQILAEFYPASCKNIIDWLLSPESFGTLMKFCKTVPGINILAHGDFWINNMMFKMEKGVPVDVRLIDFQLFRFTHPARDITHVFYTCLDRQFREQHEEAMLRAYVKAFNVAAGRQRLEYTVFRAEFEASRVFGCLLGVVLRSLNLMPDIYPEEDEALTQERFEGVMCGEQHASMPARFRREASFRSALTEVLDELVLEANKYLGAAAEPTAGLRLHSYT